MIAVLSVGNSSVYGSSRTLAALAEQGQAPKYRRQSLNSCVLNSNDEGRGLGIGGRATADKSLVVISHRSCLSAIPPSMDPHVLLLPLPSRAKPPSS
jgi:hypothetical protein